MLPSTKKYCVPSNLEELFKLCNFHELQPIVVPTSTLYIHSPLFLQQPIVLCRSEVIWGLKIFKTQM